MAATSRSASNDNSDSGRTTAESSSTSKMQD